MSVELESKSTVAATTARQDLVTSLLATWLTVGGFVDGYAHRNLDTPETFFTPWHGILYSGFLAVGAWVLWLISMNRPRSRSLRSSVPAGYETTLAGLVVFVAGGLGDGLWHTFIGIEVSIDALLSPTHLLLLLGALLILSGPLRSRWHDSSYEPRSTVVLAPALLAITMGAAEVGFFFQYMDGLSTRFMQVAYRPGVEEGFFELVAGLSSILMTTVILVGALLLLMRRWAPPPGSALFLFSVFGALMEALEGYDFPEDLIAPVAGGLAAELFIRQVAPRLGRPLGTRVVAFSVPVLMWAVRFSVFEQFSDINWPISVWTGAIFFSGLAGVGLSLLTTAPAPASGTDAGATAQRGDGSRPGLGGAVEP